MIGRDVRQKSTLETDGATSKEAQGSLGDRES
jgi:hypothetical protein